MLSDQDASKLLEQAVDMHVHTAPSLFPRSHNDVEALIEAAKYGMAGLVIKSHEGDTAARASLANQVQPTRCKAIGSIVLNHFVGGLNPYAVEVCLALGGRVVWLPTVCAANHVAYHRTNVGPFHVSASNCCNQLSPISILDGGRLRSEVIQTIDLVAKQRAVLCTGHVSQQEIACLLEQARKVSPGLRIVITHPDEYMTRIPLAVQRGLAASGAYIEKCLLATVQSWGCASLDEFVQSIVSIGPEHCILTTDSGGAGRPSSPAMLQSFIELALRLGLAAKAIRTMLVDNPHRLLEL
ncbi:MAG: DUF6282 family protein [Bacillota bacterium]